MSFKESSLYADASVKNYWPLNESSGTSLSDLKGADTLTATNSSIVGYSGKYTGAIYSDTTNYASRTPTVNQKQTGAFSFSFWTRVTDTTSSIQLFSVIQTSGNDSGWWTAYGSGNFTFYTADNSGVGANTAYSMNMAGSNDDVWHNIVVTLSNTNVGATLKAYKDKTLKLNTTLSRAISYSANLTFNVCQGVRLYFCDAIIFNKELSSTEVATIFNSPPNSNPNLIGLLL